MFLRRKSKKNIIILLDLFCVILNFIETEQDINNLIILIYSIFNKR